MARLHLNWGGYRDWHKARAKLAFLKTTLYGNFADIEGDCDAVKAALSKRGFRVTCEPYYYGTILLRLSNGKTA